MEKNTKKIAKIAFVVFVIRFCSKFIGFIRDFLIAAKFGTSYIADAYNAASIIPNMIFALIGGSIITTLIPIYKQVEVDKSKKEAFLFINNVTNILIIICIFISIVGEVFTPQFVNLIVSGFSNEGINLTIYLSKIFMVTIILNTIVYVFMAILQAEGNFTIPELIGLPYNFIILIYLIALSHKFGIVGLAVSVCVAILLQIIFEVPSVIKTGFRYKLIFNLKDKYFKQMIVAILPIILGTGIQQINPLFNGKLTASLGEGSLSSLNYGSKIYVLICEIFIYSYVTVVYPSIINYVVNNNEQGMIKLFNSTLTMLTLIILPITIFVMIFSHDTIKLFFERGIFDSRATNMTASVLFYDCIGIPAIGMLQLLARVFYSIKDTKTPAIIGAVSVFLDVALAYLLKDYLNVGGIALASSISPYINCIALYVILKRKIKGFEILDYIHNFYKILISSAVFSFVAIVSYKILNVLIQKSNTVSLFFKLSFSFVISVLVYISICAVLKISGINEAFIKVKSMVIKKR